jgi:hypothetical protein
MGARHRPNVEDLPTGLGLLRGKLAEQHRREEVVGTAPVEVIFGEIPSLVSGEADVVVRPLAISPLL